MSLGEVLGLAAAVEACSEHPLASAVLQFAAAHLATPRSTLDAELTAGLQQLEEPSEDSRLLPSPSKAQKQSSPTVTATDWLQPATDVEIEEGKSHLLLCLICLCKSCLALRNSKGAEQGTCFVRRLPGGTAFHQGCSWICCKVDTQLFWLVWHGAPSIW